MSGPEGMADPVPLSRLAEGVGLRMLPPGTLPSDIAHSLDAEVEMGGITPDQRAYVDLFDCEDLDWFRTLVHDGGARFPEVIRDRFDTWRATAAAADAMALDWAGLVGLSAQFDEASRSLALLADRSTGAPLGAEGLASLVHEADVATALVDNARSLAARTRADIDRWGIEAFLESRPRCEALYRDRGMARARDAAVSECIEWARAREGIPPSPGRRQAAGPVAELRRRAARARRVLARSHALLRSIAGAAKAKAWLSGEEVVIEGRRFDFPVRVAKVHHDGAGAVDVRVTDKAGAVLARLCVYHPDTPALDQVSALVLHVISGEEDAILATANVIQAYPAAEANPSFRSVRGGDAGGGEGIVVLGGMGPGVAAIREAIRPILAERVEREAWGRLVQVPGIGRPWRSAEGALAA